jgi:cytosine/adenosine deaminase-related metal-dependent hydrolase
VIIGDLVGTDRVLRDGYVAVRGETIAAIGQGVPPPARETLDHRGRLILPGLGRWAHAHLVGDRLAGHRRRHAQRRGRAA